MKVLVDTSVWIRFFQKKDKVLIELLKEDKVFVHLFVLGELRMGDWKNREEIFQLLSTLDLAVMVQFHEMIDFIENRKLYSRKIGYIDAHILASCKLSGLGLYTLDQPLKRVAQFLQIVLIE